MNDVTIRALLETDWPEVRRIYCQGIAAGNATFETRVPTWQDWDAAHAPACRLVARLDDGRAAGWAALSPVSVRGAYRGVAEVSVYVGEGHRGRGVGSLLLSRLISCSERHGYWTLQAAVFPENEASIGLLSGAGFRVVGVREKLGRLGGRWRDVVFMERRSPCSAPPVDISREMAGGDAPGPSGRE